MSVIFLYILMEFATIIEKIFKIVLTEGATRD